MRYRKSEKGFSLVEVAIAMAIGGVLLTSAIYMLSNYLGAQRVATTQQRMKEIDNAIIQYLDINGVLPCVASLTDAQDTPSFGRQLTDAAVYPAQPDCYAAQHSRGGKAFLSTGRIPAPPGTNTTGRIVTGAVPTRTLNLPDEYAADAWGNRFVYAVTNALTVESLYDPTQGSIFVRDSADVPVAVPDGGAQYVIVSHGPNRRGSHTLSGVAYGAGCPADSARESVNCTYTSNTFRKTMMASTQEGDAYYDDFVLFNTQTNARDSIPAGLITPFRLAACPAGWTRFTLPDCAAGYTGGAFVCCQKQ